MDPLSSFAAEQVTKYTLDKAIEQSKINIRKHDFVFKLDIVITLKDAIPIAEAEKILDEKVKAIAVIDKDSQRQSIIKYKNYEYNFNKFFTLVPKEFNIEYVKFLEDSVFENYNFPDEILEPYVSTIVITIFLKRNDNMSLDNLNYAFEFLNEIKTSFINSLNVFDPTIYLTIFSDEKILADIEKRFKIYESRHNTDKKNVTIYADSLTIKNLIDYIKLKLSIKGYLYGIVQSIQNNP